MVRREYISSAAMGVRSLPVILIAVLMLLSSGFGCSESNTASIAKVGNERILVADVVESMKIKGLTTDVDGVKEAVRHLVNFKLLISGARESAIDTTLELRKEFERMRDKLLVRRLYEDEIIRNSAATDDELKKFISRNNLDGYHVEARHIVMKWRDDEDEERRKAVLAAIGKVQQAASAGADFTELARKYSDDGLTSQSGGYLGYITRGKTAGFFGDSIFSLEPGEVSGIIESPFGFHVVKVEGVKKGTLEELKEELRVPAEQEKKHELTKKFVRRLEAKAHIRYVDSAIDSLLVLIGHAGDLDEIMGSDALVLATSDGGEWSVSKFKEYYTDFPGTRTRAPRTREDMKKIVRGMVNNELIILEAGERGIDERVSFKKEFERMKEEALVRRYIHHRITGDPEFNEKNEQEHVRELEMHLRDKFQVEVFEENFPLVLEAFARSSKEK